MNNQSSIVIFEKAELMLAEADTIQKVKEFKGLALTAAEWAKQKGLGEQAIVHAKSYALRAERKLGELIIAGQEAGEIAKPGQPKRILTDGKNTFSPVKLRDIDLTEAESYRAQRLVAVPEDDFEKIASGEKTRIQVQRELRAKNKIKIDPPKGRYGVIVIDPPWPIEKIQRDCRPNQIEVDYQTMDIEEISSMDLPALRPKLRKGENQEP